MEHAIGEIVTLPNGRKEGRQRWWKYLMGSVMDAFLRIATFVTKGIIVYHHLVQMNIAPTRKISSTKKSRRTDYD